MQDQFIVVLITVPSPEVGEQIAARLLEQKLAACVNIVPGIQSIYAWQGAIQKDQEALLVVKSRAALFAERLVPEVKSIHPYEVQEIIALPVLLGSQEYLDWIATETSQI